MKETSYYLRNPDAVLVSTTRHYLCIDISGSVVEISVRSPRIWSTLMQELMIPRRGDSLRKRFADNPGIDISEFVLFLDKGFLIEAATPSELEMRRDRLLSNNQGYYLERGDIKCGNLVLALSGSIVAGLMAPVILSLCYSGFHGKIDLILTEAALRFVNRDLFEYYGINTWVNPFERRDGVHVPHVALGQAADCILVMPASASCCHRLANGSCSDLLSMTVAASRAPVVVAPVMNANMWNHKAVQRNVQQLRDDGMYVIEPTLIFSANELVHQSDAMYGGPGTFWRGGLGVMHTLLAVMEHNLNA